MQSFATTAELVIAQQRHAGVREALEVLRYAPSNVPAEQRCRVALFVMKSSLSKQLRFAGINEGTNQ